MFKITRQTKSNALTDLYDVSWYYYDENTHSNELAFTVTNLKANELAPILQGRVGMELDMDFNLAVLKSNKGPIILGASGTMLTAPVRNTAVKEHPYVQRNRIPTRRSLFQTKKRGSLPH